MFRSVLGDQMKVCDVKGEGESNKNMKSLYSTG